MITALDSNILLDILLPNVDFVRVSAAAVEDSASIGSVVICDMVYAELCTNFALQADCDSFLEDIGIEVDPISREACFLASRAWRTYREQGGPRAKVLPDFLIGAHAQLQATRLVSRDRGFFRKYFSSLMLLDPTE
jgi:predicted nucleic acid-binding protein